MFLSDSTFEFFCQFKCDNDCRQYLSDLKWKAGFLCKKCGHRKSWKGRTAFHRRCAGCGYDESATAFTLFHKTKFPLLKAFGMLFQIVNPKNGRSTVDLARDFGIVQPTAWYFKKKFQDLVDTGVSPDDECAGTETELALDSIIIMHRGEKLNGLQRVYVSLNNFSKNEKAKQVSIKRCFLLEEDGLELSRLVRGKFEEFNTSMLLWNFKRWLTGTHHHCSFKHLKGYFSEFLFRQNHSKEPARMWHTVIEKSIHSSPSILRYNDM